MIDGIRSLNLLAYSILAGIERYLYKLYHSKLTKMPRTDSEHWQKVHVLVLLRLA